MSYKEPKQFGTTTLEGGAKVWIEPTATPTECKKCGAKIYFAMAYNKKFMPVVYKDGKWFSHFADCPYAKKFRK